MIKNKFWYSVKSIIFKAIKNWEFQTIIISRKYQIVSAGKRFLMLHMIIISYPYPHSRVSL